MQGCRDSTGRFLPVRSQKTPHVATVLWFNPLPGICGSLAVLAGPEAGLAVRSFSGWLKPGSQSLTRSLIFENWRFLGRFKPFLFN